MSVTKFDWAVKLAIEKLCERLDPDTIAQIDGVVKASIGLKQQQDRIEYTQIEIYKQNQKILNLLTPKLSGGDITAPDPNGNPHFDSGGNPRKENANSTGNGAAPKLLEPPAATGK